MCPFRALRDVRVLEPDRVGDATDRRSIALEERPAGALVLWQPLEVALAHTRQLVERLVGLEVDRHDPELDAGAQRHVTVWYCNLRQRDHEAVELQAAQHR